MRRSIHQTVRAFRLGESATVGTLNTNRGPFFIRDHALAKKGDGRLWLRTTPSANKFTLEVLNGILAGFDMGACVIPRAGTFWLTRGRSGDARLLSCHLWLDAGALQPIPQFS